jgi:hypothetical protein
MVQCGKNIFKPSPPLTTTLAIATAVIIAPVHTLAYPSH